MNSVLQIHLVVLLCCDVATAEEELSPRKTFFVLIL